MSTAANLLQQLDPKKGLTPDELADLMNLSKARLFQVAKPLADAGALIRKGDRFTGVKYFLGDASKFVEKPARVKVVKSPEQKAERTLSSHTQMVLQYMSMEAGPERDKLKAKIRDARGLTPGQKLSAYDIMRLRYKELGIVQREATTDEEGQPVAKPKRKSYYKPKGKRKKG